MQKFKNHPKPILTTDRKFGVVFFFLIIIISVPGSNLTTAKMRPPFWLYPSPKTINDFRYNQLVGSSWESKMLLKHLDERYFQVLMLCFELACLWSPTGADSWQIPGPILAVFLARFSEVLCRGFLLPTADRVTWARIT